MILYYIVGLVGLVLLLSSILFDDLFGEFLDLSFLSGTALGGFMAAFGFAGGISLSSDVPYSLSLVVGTGAGALVGAIGATASRYLRKDDGVEAPSMDNIVGRTGIVVSTITPTGMGVVSVSVGAHTNRYSAQADQTLAPGQQVTVTAALSASAVIVAATDTAS